MRGSFRLRLTLWNVFILAFALTVFAVGLMATYQRRAMGEVDRDLAFRVSRAAQNGPGPFRGGPNRPNLMGQQPPGMQGGPGEQPPDGPPPEGQIPGAPPMGGFDRDPYGYLRRPIFFGPDGKPEGQFPIEAFDTAALRRALAGEQVFSIVTIGGQRVRVLSTPRPWADGRTGAVQVARELHDFDVLWSAQIWTLAMLLPIALLAAGAGALFLTNRALKPVADATQAAAEITSKDLSRRLPVQGNDELADLAKTFNAMIERLESSFVSLQTAYNALENSYDHQRRFIADASHELRTPLTRLRLATSAALANELTQEQAKEALEVADRAAEGMTRLVQQLLTLSRADAGNLGLQLQPLDLRVVASDAIADCPPTLRQTVSADFADEPVTVKGDEDHLRRVFVNLIQNALRYTAPGCRITVSVHGAKGQAVASVADEGEGIAPEHLPHLGERFYRADAARSRDDGGSGLGLAICKSIVEAHGGRMRIESRLGVGTTVTLLLDSISSKLPSFQTTSK